MANVIQLYNIRNDSLIILKKGLVLFVKKSPINAELLASPFIDFAITKFLSITDRLEIKTSVRIEAKKAKPRAIFHISFTEILDEKIIVAKNKITPYPSLIKKTKQDKIMAFTNHLFGLRIRFLTTYKDAQISGISLFGPVTAKKTYGLTKRPKQTNWIVKLFLTNISYMSLIEK